MDPFDQWFEALESRCLQSLSFQEVRRAVQALSSIYVERRGRIVQGAALEGAGKRAAFACYFAPLHFLLVREIVRGLGAGNWATPAILDLGCGTGVAGAAWALELRPRPTLYGVDQNSWAVQEARWTWSFLGLAGSVRQADLHKVKIQRNTAVVAAFTVNELPESGRDRLKRELLRVSDSGQPVLVIEPIARRLGSWWAEWARAWRDCGGREDEWRFGLPLPPRLALMDKAAGLEHRELTGRSLWLPGLCPTNRKEGE